MQAAAPPRGIYPALCKHCDPTPRRRHHHCHASHIGGCNRRERRGGTWDTAGMVRLSSHGPIWTISITVSSPNHFHFKTSRYHVLTFSTDTELLQRIYTIHCPERQDRNIAFLFYDSLSSLTCRSKKKFVRPLELLSLDDITIFIYIYIYILCTYKYFYIYKCFASSFQRSDFDTSPTITDISLEFRSKRR